MTKTDVENVYRFIACISAGKEYMNAIQEPMLRLHSELLHEHYKQKYPNPSPKTKRWIRNKKIEELKAINSAFVSLAEKMETVIKKFDASDDTNDRALIDTVIDNLTAHLKTVEIEIKE